MTTIETELITGEYLAYLKNKDFPCIAAKAALAKQQVKCLVADHIGCPKDDQTILNFLYDFTDQYRASKDFYHSAVIIFQGPINIDEVMFDELLWQRLQALSDLDAQNYSFDKRVNALPSSATLALVLKKKRFILLGCTPIAAGNPANLSTRPWCLIHMRNLNN